MLGGDLTLAFRALQSGSVKQTEVGEHVTGSNEHLIAGIDAALASERLSAWERNFLSDMQSRINRYGDRTRLSDKQRSTLYRILGRSLTSPPPQLSGSPPRERINLRPLTPRSLRMIKRSYVANRRRRPSFIHREARWWGRRLARDAMMAAAVALVFGLFMLVESVSSLWQPTSSGTQLTASSGLSGVTPSFTVTDGDTIHISGEANGTRLIGFNTPEKFSPQCAREEQLGHRATARLKELVSTSTISLTKVPCSCRPGTHGTDKCNYGRSCAILKANGRNVGDILISEGLAAPFVCGPTGCPPTPRPWCG